MRDVLHAKGNDSAERNFKKEPRRNECSVLWMVNLGPQRFPPSLISKKDKADSSDATKLDNLMMVGSGIFFYWILGTFENYDRSQSY